MGSKLRRKRQSGSSSLLRLGRNSSTADDNHSKSEDSESGEISDDNAAREPTVDCSDQGYRDFWPGITGQLDEEGGQTTESGKKRILPSGEELRVIKDATSLFQSQSFKLQIDALLPNVRPNLSKTSPLDRFLFELHAFLNSIPSVAPENPLQASRRLLEKGVAVPYCFPLPMEDTNWKVSFERPCDISLVGSWANKTCVKGKDGTKFGVDLAVEMPPGLFQEKDHLNGRFFQKKAFYLATIAEAVKHSKSGQSLEVDAFYDCAANDIRLTTLVLCSRKGKSSNDFSKLNAYVRIMPTSSASSPILLRRLSPSRRNIRISLSSHDVSQNDDLATPLYNNALLTCYVPKVDLIHTHTLIQDVASFNDALSLLRVWANQRGYGNGNKGCVMGFEGKGSWWCTILRLLLTGEELHGNGAKRKPLGRELSSYQLFKAALDFLAVHDFAKEPVFLKADDSFPILFHEYLERYDASFVDSSAGLNLLAGVPLCSLEMLKYDAKKSIELLSKATFNSDPFPELFLTDRRSLCSRFDAILRVDLSTAKERCPSLHDVLDRGSQAAALLSSLISLFRRGLGNRSTAIAILYPTSEPRPISQAHPISTPIVHIGLIHDQEHAFRLVDQGPNLDDVDRDATERFRDLWGEKAELRRFKDGRIVESVVWDVVTSDDRTHIPSRMVRHLLGRHYGIAGSAIQTFQEPFDSVLRLPKSFAHHYRTMSTGFRAAISAFDDLVKAVKAMNDLPLAVLSVGACSEYLRYTSVFVPVPASTLSGYTPSMEVILEFEKSAKWPDDLPAIQHMKLAFFERIATLLMSSIKGLKATVVLGDGACTSGFQVQAMLEVITPQGWVFAIRLWHDREAALLDRITDSKSHIISRNPPPNPKKYQQAIEAKEILHRRFIHGPHHHRAIATLCHRYPAYSGTVRLVKRWLASHWLLRGHVTEEAVEIICASVFLNTTNNASPSTSTPATGLPGSKERGFSVVVEWLKDWKWQNGIFVPIYSASDPKITLAVTEVMRAQSACGVWRLSTEADKEGAVWTSRCPDIVAANRIQALAAATWNRLSGMEDGSLDVKMLFTHSTDDYDFVIHLDPACIPNHHQSIRANPNAPMTQYPGLQMARPGFNPPMLLFRDLQNIYANTLRFFYDPFGGDQIGAVWEPSVKTSRPFKTLSEFSSIPQTCEASKHKDFVRLNDIAIFNEIARLGKNLVTEIKVRSNVQ